MLVRGVVFPLASELPPEARFLLEDFRLAVNEAIRVGLAGRITSRNGWALEAESSNASAVGTSTST
jgi:hypothetical protein